MNLSDSDTNDDPTAPVNKGMPPIQILQWNANKIKGKKSNLQFTVDRLRPQVILLQETWDPNFKLRNYAIFRPTP